MILHLYRRIVRLETRWFPVGHCAESAQNDLDAQILGVTGTSRLVMAPHTDGGIGCDSWPESSSEGQPLSGRGKGGVPVGEGIRFWLAVGVVDRHEEGEAGCPGREGSPARR